MVGAFAPFFQKSTISSVKQWSNVSSFSEDTAGRGANRVHLRKSDDGSHAAENIRARGGGDRDIIAARPKSIPNNPDDAEANFQTVAAGQTERCLPNTFPFDRRFLPEKCCPWVTGNACHAAHMLRLVKTAGVSFDKAFYIGPLEDDELRIIVFKEICAPIYSNFTFTRRSLTGYHDAMFSAR